MLSDPRSFEEILRFPPERDGFVSFGGHRGRQHPMHRHAELEMNLVTGGTAQYLLGDRRYDLCAGSLVWLFPRQDHVLLDRSPDYAHWVVVWRPEAVERACRSRPGHTLREPDPPGRFCRRLPHDDVARLHALMAELAEVARDDPDRFNAGLGYLLLTAWARYERAAEVPTGSDVHPAVEKAVRLLRDGDGGDLSVDEIGRRCGLSGAHLARLFRAQTGVSLVAFRNRQRLDRFLRLYSRGHRGSMLQAALDAGFGSYPQFHRVFTEAMGRSPAEYRRQLRRKQD